MRNAGWLLQYGTTILLALLLGLFLARVPLFQETTVKLGKLPLLKKTSVARSTLRASHMVQYVGYGGALLLLWAVGPRLAREIPESGKGRLLLRRIVTPLTTMIVLSLAYHAFLLPGEKPVLDKAGMESYNRFFIMAIMTSGVWLILAPLLRSSPKEKS